MGLFSSKSKSSSSTTTNYTDSSTDVNNAASLGAFSHDNNVIGAGGSYTYNEQGLTGENLDSVLGYSESLYDKAYNTLSQTISSVQKSAETAINAASDAYAESDNELRNTIDGLRPIALYAALAAVVYFIFKR